MKIEELADALLAELKGYVTDAAAVWTRGVEALQGTVAELRAGIQTLKGDVDTVKTALADGSLRGKDGRDGERGPAGEKGEAGERGEAGAPAPAPTGEEVRGHVRALLLGFPEIVGEEVKAWLAENPPADGKDGVDGKDGTSVTLDQVKELVESQTARWQLDFERRAQETIQRAIDKIPTPRDGQHGRDGRDGKDGKNGTDGVDGKDGVDGLSVESLERTYDAETHEVVERWVAVGKTKELRYPAGGIRHGGYWREGTKAAAAETWTHMGIAWIAMKDTTTKPGYDATDWQIFASKGRDGTNGKDGRDLGPPAPVKLHG